MYYSPRRRYKRGAHTEEEILDFIDKVQKFKDMKKDMVSNLTCILANLGTLDRNLDINIRFYTHDAWNMMAEPVYPELRNKLVEKAEDCYAMSNAMPQYFFEKHPLAKKFGRQMLFFKCHFVSMIVLHSDIQSEAEISVLCSIKSVFRQQNVYLFVILCMYRF